MAEDRIQINMLGQFGITWRGEALENIGSRSRKSGMLLAYLFYNRDRQIPKAELEKVLWENDAGTENINAAMKTLLHRTRAVLECFGEKAGFELILVKKGTFGINPDIEVTSDYERLEEICRELLAAREASAVDLYKLFTGAAALYRGDFLPKFSMEHWVAPLEVYYRDLFINAAEFTLERMETAGMSPEIIEVSSCALKMEPWNENLCRHLMRASIDMGDNEGATAAYEKLRELLYSSFGTVPSEECAELYRKALSPVRGRVLAEGILTEELREDLESVEEGAIVCEFDIFRELYRAQARLLSRSGDACHVALITANPVREISRKSLDKVMNDLISRIKADLRAGDVISRCSSNQLVLMLPGANFENSAAVCDRIIKTYRRAYPHTTVDITSSVMALEPNMF